MTCGCDSGLVIVIFILSSLLACVIWLLFYDFTEPCDKETLNSTVRRKKFTFPIHNVNLQTNFLKILFFKVEQNVNKLWQLSCAKLTSVSVQYDLKLAKKL